MRSWTANTAWKHARGCCVSRHPIERSIRETGLYSWGPALRLYIGRERTVYSRGFSALQKLENRENDGEYVSVAFWIARLRPLVLGIRLWMLYLVQQTYNFVLKHELITWGIGLSLETVRRRWEPWGATRIIPYRGWGWRPRHPWESVSPVKYIHISWNSPSSLSRIKHDFLQHITTWLDPHHQACANLLPKVYQLSTETGRYRGFGLRYTNVTCTMWQRPNRRATGFENSPKLHRVYGVCRVRWFSICNVTYV